MNPDENEQVTSETDCQDAGADVFGITRPIDDGELLSNRFDAIEINGVHYDYGANASIRLCISGVNSGKRTLLIKTDTDIELTSTKKALEELEQDFSAIRNSYVDFITKTLGLYIYPESISSVFVKYLTDPGFDKNITEYLQDILLIAKNEYCKFKNPSCAYETFKNAAPYFLMDAEQNDGLEEIRQVFQKIIMMVDVD